MSLYSQQELENIFANNFASPLFPILSNLYYEKKEYDRAQKVCEIGLTHNNKNYIGQFMLAKIYIIKKKYIAAEKILKKVIDNDSHNVNGLISLVETQKILKRSNDRIQYYINKGLALHIEHKLFKKTTANKNKFLEKTSIQKPNFIPDIMFVKNSIQLNTNMATKTMYNLMMKQQKHDIAMSILKIMKSKKKNVKYVNLELKKLSVLINKRKK